MTRLTNIIDLLFRPDTFFSRISQEKESLLLPALIVLLGSITELLIQIYYLVSTQYSSSDAAFADFFHRMVMVLAYPILGSLVLWAAASISIYAVSKMFSGTGSLKITFQNIGYSVLPIVLWSMLIDVLSKIATVAIERTGDYSFAAYTNHTLGQLSLSLHSGWVLLALLLWTGYLCVRGTMNAHRITMAKAIVAVIVGGIMAFLVAGTYDYFRQRWRFLEMM